MRSTLLITAAAVLGLLAPLPLISESAQADGLGSRSDVMPVKDVRRGMKGYGLTVFEGVEPERFDVEVIDVLENFQPRQELILIKTHHPRLEVAKVVAGMSGSPIYINDKMIGAYAYGWTFGKEPVAGVTPIRAMLEDLARPIPKTIHGWPLRIVPPPLSARNGAGASSPNGLEDYSLRDHATKLAESRGDRVPQGPLKPVSTPLLMGGLSSGTISMARELFGPLGLEPLQAGGGSGTDPDAPKRYVEGGAIGVEMVRGDMSAMGLGTVTRVEGDRLIAFGHPMMQSGVTAMPTAIGRVLWFLASDMRSFKIGTAVRSVGAMINDRAASIVVSHSAKAPVIPVKMKIHGVPGAPYTDWSFEIAHEKFMTPAFVSMALGEALQSTAAERQDVSWTAKSRVAIKDHGTVDIEDFGVSVGGTPESRDFMNSNLVDAVGGLLNNPWRPVLLEGVEVDIEMRYAREILRLRGAEVLESELDAGEPARIRLTLIPYSGEPITRVVSVPLPAHLAGETLTLEITPGYTEERDRAEPENLKEFVNALGDQVYPPKSLVVSFDAGGGTVAYRGHIARDLPPGALDSIRPVTSSVAPDSLDSPTRHIVPMPQYIVGQDKVQVTIHPVLK